jgi:eukaryotic-like serine/threonine-protein kinase
LNPVTEHPDRERLSAFLNGQLSDAEQTALAHHIDGCETCCEMLRAIPDDAFIVRLRNANTPANGGVDEAVSVSPRARPLPKELLEHPRYKIGRFLGAGGMGAVYQAEHRLMDRVVALKIIHRNLSRHPRVVERFRLEVKAAARLSHPNIVTAHDAEKAGDVHFLVMEFVDGMSLSQLVAKRGPLEPPAACAFARQTAEGLQHAFESGMVHRDIKPHNLMLTSKGQIKILDFGLARLASETRKELGLSLGVDRPELTKMGDIMGTPEFMAPEQFADASSADIRADIYSLGCTLYYLLTGQAPFTGETTLAVMLAKQGGASRPIGQLRDDLPTDLIAVINRMMAKTPEQRFQTPAEVVKALAAFLKPMPATPMVAVARPAAPPGVADVRGFLAQCPFCTVRFRIPDKSLGASVPCPHCGSSFTAAPV